MKRIVFVAPLALLIFAATSAFACPPGGGGPGGHRGGLLKAAGLTPEQHAQVKALRQAMRAKMEPVHLQMQTKMLEMLDLWRVEKPDRAKILAKSAELDAIQKTMHEAHIDMKLQVHALLTPEQRIKVINAMLEMQKRMGGRPGRGPGGCPGCDGGDDDDE